MTLTFVIGMLYSLSCRRISPQVRRPAGLPQPSSSRQEAVTVSSSLWRAGLTLVSPSRACRLAVVQGSDVFCILLVAGWRPGRCAGLLLLVRSASQMVAQEA